MGSTKAFSIALFSVFFFLFPLGLYSTTFTVTNKCTYTVWPAILSSVGSSSLPNTGFALESGDSKTFPVPPTWSGRLWGRTLCSVDTTGKFSCVTGDCGTSTVECAGGNPTSPVTLVEFDFNSTSGLMLYDISLVEGFNLPVKVNMAACPMELKVTRDGEAMACRSTYQTACSDARLNVHDHSFFTCSSTRYTFIFCPTSTSKSGTKSKKKEHSNKKAGSHIGVYIGGGSVLTVGTLFGVFFGCIKFRARVRYPRDGAWEINLEAETVQCLYCMYSD